MKIVIPFVQIDADNPNLRKKDVSLSSSTYFQCIVVSFASLRYLHPTLQLQLTTNRSLPEEYSRQLEAINVNTKLVTYEHNPPASFGNRFRGCFYLIDAIKAENEDTLYLDPDIFCIRPIPIEKMKLDSIAALDLKFGDLKNINGITPKDARSISSLLLGKTFDNVHKHFGGEAIYIPNILKEKLVTEIEVIWQKNLILAEMGRAFLPTEEHILSIVFSNYTVEELNFIILRIWTTIKYSKTEGGKTDLGRLSLWHLPAEKSYGFIKAYELYQQGNLFNKKKNGNIIDFYSTLFGINNTFLQKLWFRNPLSQ